MEAMKPRIAYLEGAVAALSAENVLLREQIAIHASAITSAAPANDLTDLTAKVNDLASTTGTRLDTIEAEIGADPVEQPAPAPVTAAPVDAPAPAVPAVEEPAPEA